MCVDHNELALADARCNSENRPADAELCGPTLPYCSADEDNNENSNMI